MPAEVRHPYLTMIVEGNIKLPSINSENLEQWYVSNKTTIKDSKCDSFESIFEIKE